MAETASQDSDVSQRPTRWPWLLFALAAAWSILIRIPLVLNAPVHLDSDLAVDGLTLLEATHGHWRWHYPGTPFIGSGPVLYSLVPALIWGATPETLVSGGVVAWLGVLLATFWLAWRTSGPRVAVWSLVPLTFASTGTIWLSGRITGGHLTAAACHAGVFALLAGCLGTKRGGKRVAILGLWCGLSFALDSMLAVTLLGVATAALVFWIGHGVPRRGILTALVFTSGFLGGVWPRYVGAWVDPYDVYQEQFAPVARTDVLALHARILLEDCLPRLIAGHRVPGLESDPDPSSIAAPGVSRRRSTFDPIGALVVGVTFSLAAAALLALGRELLPGRSPVSRAIVLGLAVSGLATLAGFVVNRNIFNSDNYRYLVTLLVPWSFGFGLAMDRLARRGRGGLALGLAIAVLLAVVMTADLSNWYARFRWIDGQGRPVRRPLNDPILAWLNGHPEMTWIDGGYWDVYRLTFLTGGRVRGAPFPMYPNRFPEWRAARDQNRATLVRLDPYGPIDHNRALKSGQHEVFRARGVTVYAWTREQIER